MTAPADVRRPKSTAAAIRNQNDFMRNSLFAPLRFRGVPSRLSIQLVEPGQHLIGGLGGVELADSFAFAVDDDHCGKSGGDVLGSEFAVSFRVHQHGAVSGEAAG